jgi:HD-GYP domain-containing protein (c-di-GMP phosphodiesterase class II)
MVLARAPEILRGEKHPDRLLLLLPDASFTVAPALVIALLGQAAVGGRPTAGDGELLAVFALAMAAQFSFDAAFGTLRERLIFGGAPSVDLALFARIAAADAALAPVALVVALAAREHPLAIAAVMPLVALFNVFAREREQRLTSAVELSSAYRGTALLMSDLLEADDAYTGGEHSRGVVDLALGVGERLGLDPAAQRDLEFGAMLHDIGKIHMPDEILNKPGLLDPDEWEVIKRHPEDGQRMLERVGGALARVGLIVRGHHEAFAGGGYPDGLVGEAIPLAARIISACDAFSAMTTTRSYRAAMPVADAVAELRRCSGTQFDPVVVDALLALVGPAAAGAAPAAREAVPAAA